MTKCKRKPLNRKSSCEIGGVEERWEAPDHSQGVLPQNWDGTEQNRTVTCMVHEAKANVWHKNLALSHQ
ncbi:hypothetical protein TNCV_5131541 [Trichonephila clavipes]|nr:hypothetical protein TNCV_5131541 [Trichonephila clavipes]